MFDLRASANLYQNVNFNVWATMPVAPLASAVLAKGLEIKFKSSLATKASKAAIAGVIFVNICCAPSRRPAECRENSKRTAWRFSLAELGIH